VTVFSYLDRICFGVLACRRLVPDLEQMADYLDEALAELVVGALDLAGATA
jgi:hypothetical protein